MPLIQINDEIEINYIEEGQGEPLVLIPGSNTKWQAWHYQIKFFKEKMRVIAFDNRGAGLSSRPDFDYTMEMFVNDLKGLLDGLKITTPIHLCGISLGGMIALEFVLKYPKKVKTLILLATTAYYEPSQVELATSAYKQFWELNFDERFETTLRLLYTNAFKRKLRKDSELLDSLKKDLNIAVYREAAPEYKDLINQLKAYAKFDIRDKLDRIKQPSLIITGSADRNIPPQASRYLHEKIPNSKLEILPKLKHGFTIESPDIVNKLIWDFLRDFT